MKYRYSAKELRELARAYGRTMKGEDYDGRKMEARRCPVCAVYEVIDIKTKVYILPCKCDIQDIHGVFNVRFNGTVLLARNGSHCSENGSVTMNDLQRLYVMARSLTMTARVSDIAHKELSLSSSVLWDAMTHEEKIGAMDRMHEHDVYSAPLSIAYGE